MKADWQVMRVLVEILVGGEDCRLGAIGNGTKQQIDLTRRDAPTAASVEKAGSRDKVFFLQRCVSKGC